VISSTTAPWPSTRRDHSRLNSSMDSPIRVPPDQSGTARLTISKAASGSRWRSWRVTLVSRVPNRKE
jgi:hypothetical protein